MRAKKITKETLLQLDVIDRGFDHFAIGDTIAVSQAIQEGGKERIQIFEGDVIARHNKGLGTTFTVRKIGAHGIAIERIFPLYSPIIRGIKRVTQGSVRRAKLYYIRERVGRHARIKEKKTVRAFKTGAKLNSTANDSFLQASN